MLKLKIRAHQYDLKPRKIGEFLSAKYTKHLKKSYKS